MVGGGTSQEYAALALRGREDQARPLQSAAVQLGNGRRQRSIESSSSEVRPASERNGVAENALGRGSRTGRPGR